jgi:hypothetical protein
MRVVGHAQLVGNGQEKGVGLCDSLVAPWLLDEDIRFGGIGTAEDRPGPRIDG